MKMISRSTGQLTVVGGDLHFDERPVTHDELTDRRRSINNSFGNINSPSLQLDTPDREVFINYACHNLPFLIFPNVHWGVFKLEAVLRRFPYTIDGQPGFEHYGVRLVPVAGRIQHVVIDEDSPITISDVFSSDEGMFFEMGNSSTRCEIYFEPRPNLDPIQPPHGHKSEVVLIT